jgi:hypothetical protein
MRESRQAFDGLPDEGCFCPRCGISDNLTSDAFERRQVPSEARGS